jgi:lipid II isoglutaminyl synthase (glutamine-hydrolysing)
VPGLGSHDRGRRLRIVHLFPDLFRVYGDIGNVHTLAARARARRIDVEVGTVLVGHSRLPTAEIFVIGGGQDREQVTVARELERHGSALCDQVAAGAALLAVCGGFQNLGLSYRTSAGADLFCPGLLDVRTDGSGRGRRLVGPVVGRTGPELAAMAALRGARVAPGQPVGTIVGFENHGARSWLLPGTRPLAGVGSGTGNNGLDGTEGLLAVPGAGGMAGLRVGTYLHGPLLPRNPHLADLILLAALGRADLIAHLGDARPSPELPGDLSAALPPLDDRAEWAAHADAIRASGSVAGPGHGRPEGRLGPLRRLIGF